MSNLSQLNLLDLIPGSIASDPAVLAAAQALDTHLQQIVAESQNLLLYARIDSLEEPVLSHLAYRFKVEFWEDDLAGAKKRELIKTSIAWHKIKGTPAAIKLVGEIVFGSVDVTEWFNYGGQSQAFKVRTGDVVSDEKQYERLFRLVDIAKNERSFLDALVLAKQKQGTVRCGGALRVKKRTVIYPHAGNSTGTSTQTVGGVIRTVKRTVISPVAVDPIITENSRVYTAGIIRTIKRVKIGVNDA